jgi:hypothetical protein
MKPRHAAALALVVWYVLVPPFEEPQDPRSSEPQFIQQAPLYEWLIIETYDNESNCKGELTMIQGDYHQRCVSSDDPRIKGKQLQYAPRQQ